jgi:NADH:ubiquinone oxidoreductase subunit 5 (subunit L)/multisubunit Na+/H+ antiporter MnhA subunit
MLGVSLFGLLGLASPSLNPESFIEHQMDRTLEGLGIQELFAHAGKEFEVTHVEFGTKLTAFASSGAIILIGGIVAWTFYWARRINSWDFVNKNSILKSIHSFVWNRWYINDFYYAVGVNGFLALCRGINSTIESALLGVNDVARNGFTGLWDQAKRIQTGWLSINLLYLSGLLLFFLFLVIIKGVS